MAETKRRGAMNGPRGGPPDEASSLVPDHLPLARAASIIAVVVLAGALFGYDQGVISGALLGIQKAFDVGHVALEIVTSWVTLGALFGSLGGGYAADLFGRKRALLAAAALFIIGALVQAFAPNVPVLVFGRLVAGFGVGVAAVAAPLYAAELAPASQRGRFVSSYQLAITIGIFVAYFVNQALAGPDGWRTMLGVAAVPGALLALAVLAAVESPRWFAKVGRRDDALRTLVALGAENDAEARLAAIAKSLRAEVKAPSWGDSLRALANAADNRPRACRPAAAHRHQRHHLLLQQHLRRRRLCDARRASPSHNLGDRRGQRALHLHRDRLHRWPRPAPAPDRGSHRHGAEPCRGRLRVLAIGGAGQPGKLGGRDHARRPCRFHHLICILGWPGHMDGDQRDLSERVSWTGRGGGDGSQLGCSVPRQRIFLVISERDRTGVHVLAIRGVLRDRSHLGRCRRARDTRPIAGRDRGVVEPAPGAGSK